MSDKNKRGPVLADGAPSSATNRLNSKTYGEASSSVPPMRCAIEPGLELRGCAREMPGLVIVYFFCWHLDALGAWRPVPGNMATAVISAVPSEQDLVDIEEANLLLIEDARAFLRKRPAGSEVQ